MPGSASISVNSLPAAHNLLGGGSFCAGGAGADISLDGSDAGITYQLLNGIAPVGTAAGGSGVAIDFGSFAVPGNYTVLATDGITGCSQTMTGTDIISINPLPAAYVVTGGGNICSSGGSVHIGLGHSDLGTSYQVYSGTTTIGTPVGGNGGVIDLGTLVSAGTYTVIGTNAATGCLNTMSGSVSVAVYPDIPLHTITGGGSFFCVGGTGVHIGLDGSDPGYSYQLIVAGSPVGAAVAGTGVAIDFGLQTAAGSYTVKATNLVTGCTATMAGTASVVVNGQPAIHIVTGGGNYCSGTPGVHIGLDGSENSAIYQLVSGTTTGSPLAGTGTALDFGAITAVGSYSVLATNLMTGCSVTMAGLTSVAVSASPLVYDVTGGGAVCAGSPGEHITLSWSDAGTNYQLIKNGLAAGDAISGTGGPLDFGVQNAGSYTVAATGAATGCINNMAGTAVVVVNALPDTFTVTGGGAYCSGGAGMHINLNGSESGVNYLLHTGTGTVATVPGTGAAIDFGLQTAAGVYTVTAMKTATGCTDGMAGSATVSLAPQPTAQLVSGGGSFCSGGAGVHIYLNSSASSIGYQLYNGTAIAGVPVYGTGSAIDFGTQTASGIYTVVATDLSSGCTAVMSGSAAVATLPVPAAFGVTGGGSLCSGGTGPHILLGGSATGISYQLFNDGIATGSPLSGTGSALDLGSQSAAGTYTVIATNTANGCTAYMSGAPLVSGGALPSVFAVTGSGSGGYCAGGTGISVFLGNSEPGVSYQLYRGTLPTGTVVSGTGSALSFGPQTIAGNYSVVAQNVATGCSGNMSGSVSVFVNPLPVAFNVTGGGGICSGGSGTHINLSGSENGVTYQLLHAGAATGAVVSGTGSALDMGVQTLSGTYTIMATNTATGCGMSMTGSASIFSNMSPAAFTVTGGGSFCAGTAAPHVTLSGSATGVTYQLRLSGVPAGAPVTGTGSVIDFGPQAVPGSYTIAATGVTTGCSTNMSGSATVNMLAQPAVQTVSGGGAYCAGGPGVHVALSGSGSNVSYKLYNGSVLTGTTAGTGFGLDFGLLTAPGTYTVIAVDNTTTCNRNMAGTAVVSIENLPDIFPVTGGGTYCSGGSGTSVGLGSSASGISYALMNGVALVGTSTGTGTVLDFGPQTAAGVYSVKATDPVSGCSSSMSGSATVAIAPVTVPTAGITSTGGDTICEGTLTTFNASYTGGGTAPVYQWSINGVVTGAGSAYSYVPVNGDVVGLMLTSSAVCAIPASVNASAAITVLTRHAPDVTISADPGIEVCQGTSVMFTAAPSFGGTVPAYQWLKSGVLVNTGATYSYLPVNGDVITCKMTSNYQCLLSNPAISAATTMVVDTAGTPVIALSIYPGVNVSAGESVTFEASVTRGGPAPVYAWAVNGITVSGASASSFTTSTLNDKDVVTCNVISSGGCAGTPASESVTMHVVGVGVPSIAAAGEISVVPNPSSGTFTIEGSMGDAREVAVTVTDILGQVIYTEQIATPGGNISKVVSLGKSVASGIYILNLRNGSDSRTFHIVVKQ